VFKEYDGLPNKSGASEKQVRFFIKIPKIRRFLHIIGLFLYKNNVLRKTG